MCVFIMIQQLLFCVILSSTSYANAQEHPSEQDGSLYEDLYFITVDKMAGFFQEDVNIYEAMNESSRSIGEAPQDGLCYVLKQIGEWLYIESGEVRGFVKTQEVIMGQDRLMEQQIKETNEGRISIILDIDEEGHISRGDFELEDESLFVVATSLVKPNENKAFSYTQTTTQQTLLEKQYLIPKQAVSIMEHKDKGARVLGALSKEGLAFLILEEGEWSYVESGSVRGFARTESFTKTQEVHSEEEYSLARQLIHPSQNESLYYTLTSVYEGDATRSIRKSIATYAQQIPQSKLDTHDNGYELMQSIYKKYGYSIPLTREKQSEEAKVIAIDGVRPGDLVYWTYNGTLSEPAIYIGDDKILVFSNAEKAVSLRDMKKSGSIWAIDFLSPRREEYLGEFRLTAYCNCKICTGIWAEAPTASGVKPVEGRTVAMWGIPFGTSLLINGEVYVVEDRGTPYGHIDIFVEDHARGLEFGVQYADVSKIW